MISPFAAGSLDRRRTGRRGGGAISGSLEELKALSKTPDDLARIHMDADGQYYLPEESNPLSNLTGVGADMANARARMDQGGRAGSKAGNQQLAMMAKHGVNFGPMWGDVADLNRGRRATGFAAEHDPLAEFAGAAQRAAPAANAAVADTMMGNAQAMAGQEASRDYTNLLAGNGIDTEKAAYQLGPDWQRSSPGAIASYQWGEPQTAGLGRRQQQRRPTAGGSRAVR